MRPILRATTVPPPPARCVAEAEVLAKDGDAPGCVIMATAAFTVTEFP